MAADDLREPGSSSQTLRQRSAAHVEIAVAKAGLLADVGVSLDREGKHISRGQDLDVRDDHLHLAGLQARVYRFGGPGGHFAGDADDALDTKCGEGFERRDVRMGDQLHDPARLDTSGVAEIDEKQPAVIALCGDPPGEPHPPADIFTSKISSPGIAKLVLG
jgi:hypothetical protein